jgi:hypothetical protein
MVVSAIGSCQLATRARKQRTSKRCHLLLRGFDPSLSAYHLSSPGELTACLRAHPGSPTPFLQPVVGQNASKACHCEAHLTTSKLDVFYSHRRHEANSSMIMPRGFTLLEDSPSAGASI